MTDTASDTTNSPEDTRNTEDTGLDQRRAVAVGETIDVVLPHSEVCMHLRVAGQIRAIQVLDQMAQILNDDGTPFSIPITYGEAGVRRDGALLFADPLPAHPLRVYRDGEPLSPRMADDGACLRWIHDRVGYSAWHALAHEGYSIEPTDLIPAGDPTRPDIPATETTTETTVKPGTEADTEADTEASVVGEVAGSPTAETTRG